MKNNKTVKGYAELQYKDDRNLTTRMNLWSYGTNPVSLHKWIFDKILLQKNERVLELGCGTGQLWFENCNNVPSTCSIVLSDFSKNMLDKARKRLNSSKLPIKFEIIDAERIPYPDQIFDVVIGCHMLYHVPNIEKALNSINQVLKLNGRFISTTTSQQHILELKNFLSEFGLDLDANMELFTEFKNETGLEVLKPFFEEVDLFEYINHVNITSVDPLMRYIESMFPEKFYPNFDEIKPQIGDAIIDIIKKKSKFKITGKSGLFIAKKPIKR